MHLVAGVDGRGVLTKLVVLALFKLAKRLYRFGVAVVVDGGVWKVLGGDAVHCWVLECFTFELSHFIFVKGPVIGNIIQAVVVVG